MNNFLRLLLVLGFFQTLSAQTGQREQFPLFPECASSRAEQQEACFYNTLQNFVFEKFNCPEEVKAKNYKGSIIALFEVDTTGTFKVLYADAAEKSLVDETKRVFSILPKVEPAKYAGKPTYARYSIKIAIPLVKPSPFGAEAIVEDVRNKKEKTIDPNTESKEYETIVYKKFNNPQFKSYLNLPFTHNNYGIFDAALNVVGSNNHTASKPYSYAEVSKYYDLNAVYQQNMKPVQSWWGRKLWNENLVAIQGEQYWFTMNPIFDFRLGKDFDRDDVDNTFVNTRGIQIQGALGKELFFSTSIFESQGRFAGYYNDYARSIRPSGGNPAIIPGVGIAKEFKKDAFDFPSAEANITYKPSDMINLQLGYGRNFIGDGYRSLLTSDVASPYPFFKINTTFWKIKYTNTYMWLKDVRDAVTVDKTYATKYMANHYLSWNASKRLNVGFFESVIWTNTNDRGFDLNFVNPIIFYRSVEFSSSSRSGNATLGLTSKYKWNSKVNLYGQFLLDEFSLGDMTGSGQSWKNKFGYQLGGKYYDAFNVKNLMLQMEYNHVRPYVYSHSSIVTNYGHNNQSMGHLWGANFREVVAIGRFYKQRWFAEAKLVYGIKGFDYESAGPGTNYGGDIYRNYEDERYADSGVKIAQGNKTNIMVADLMAGYTVNPTMNLKVFGNLIFRNFDPTKETATTIKSNTTWFSIGLRSDLFNWYYDF
ncbi:gliding motility protein RemB [Flavobacterium sp. SM15]|uniref:gliding motility protein RemB n=1 Tax=Flavobacterium sp. SM15 TaxID=2908005 RepID=UPI001ED9E75E|nr:gliding motility protein RemB [Flavobacterium sp. SM15]MCG2610822.1 gliding motility protein RemB [Flavobacterium sp. SM15]